MNTYTVALMTSYGHMLGETCHPLAIGVDKATAKSIRRHFDKECTYDEYRDEGTYVVMVSRTYCMNHEDFEKETSIEDMFDDDYDIFEPSAEDLKEWQMASCGLV